jgi:hypothetical protein
MSRNTIIVFLDHTHKLLDLICIFQVEYLSFLASSGEI